MSEQQEQTILMVAPEKFEMQPKKGDLLASDLGIEQEPNAEQENDSESKEGLATRAPADMLLSTAQPPASVVLQDFSNVSESQKSEAEEMNEDDLSSNNNNVLPILGNSVARTQDITAQSAKLVESLQQDGEAIKKEIIDALINSRKREEKLRQYVAKADAKLALQSSDYHNLAAQALATSEKLERRLSESERQRAQLRMELEKAYSYINSTSKSPVEENETELGDNEDNVEDETNEIEKEDNQTTTADEIENVRHLSQDNYETTDDEETEDRNDSNNEVNDTEIKEAQPIEEISMLTREDMHLNELTNACILSQKSRATLAASADLANVQKEAEISALALQIKQLQSSLLAERARVHSLVVENEMLKNENNTLSSAYEQVKDIAQKRGQALRDSANEFGKVVLQIKQKDAEIEDLKNTIDAEHQRHLAQVDDINMLRDDAEELKSQLESYKAGWERIRKSLAVMNQVMDNSEQKAELASSKMFSN